jgi:hypothetical protein
MKRSPGATAGRAPQTDPPGTPSIVLADVDVRFELPNEFLADDPRRQGFVVLAAFLVSFLFIRTSARLTRSVSWWPGGVVKDGVHLHHLVWGICLLLIAGFLGFALEPGSPWGEILAALFGIGAGFTLDEFALWVHLEDVYWAEQGRLSLDAVIVATVLGGLVVLGLSPFELDDPGPTVVLISSVVIDLAFCIVAILKGKLLVALVGVFIPPVSLVGSIRLARPGSPWARRFYKPESRKLSRAEARFTRYGRRRRRFLDLIGGAPSKASG